jgi:hypothetical protein
MEILRRYPFDIRIMFFQDFDTLADVSLQLSGDAYCDKTSEVHRFSANKRLSISAK